MPPLIFKRRTFETGTFLAEIFSVQGRFLKRRIFACRCAFSTRAARNDNQSFWKHNAIIGVLQRGIGTFHVRVRPDAHITRKATKTHTRTHTHTAHTHTHTHTHTKPNVSPALQATLWAMLWAMLWATLWTCYERFHRENGFRAPLTTPITFGPKFL